MGGSNDEVVEEDEEDFGGDGFSWLKVEMVVDGRLSGNKRLRKTYQREQGATEREREAGGERHMTGKNWRQLREKERLRLGLGF